MGIADILQPFAASLSYICVLALATFAITLIYKTSATTNFAQGSIAIFASYIGCKLFVNLGVPYWICIIISFVIGFLFGIVVDVGIFRRGRYVNLAGKQIITMGLVLIITSIMPMIGLVFSYDPSIPPFIKVPDSEFVKNNNLLIQMGGKVLDLPIHGLVCLGITAIILGILFILLRFSKWGLGVRTTASNEYVAQMMGVNTHIITALSWGIAGALGAVAALMYASSRGTITMTFMGEFQVNAFLSGILGGFGTFFGPIVASIGIPVVTKFIGLFGQIDGLEFIMSYDKVLVYLLALVIILIKPNGIFGKKVVKKV